MCSLSHHVVQGKRPLSIQGDSSFTLGGHHARGTPVFPPARTRMDYADSAFHSAEEDGTLVPKIEADALRELMAQNSKESSKEFLSKPCGHSPDPREVKSDRFSRLQVGKQRVFHLDTDNPGGQSLTEGAEPNWNGVHDGSSLMSMSM